MRNAAKIYPVLALILILSPSFASSEDLSLSGHLKYQADYSYFDSQSIAADLGPNDTFDNEIDARLNLEKQFDQYEVEAQGEILGLAGTGVKAKQNSLGALSGISRSILPSDRRRFLDLTLRQNSSEDYDIVARMDRLNATYLNGPVVAKIGRQAVTWGNGLAFQVFDLFNPFSPIAIDKDYKTGEDMVLLQSQILSDNDVQVLYVPRRDIVSHDVEWEESSVAGKYHGRLEKVDYDFIMGEHFEEMVYGIGGSRDLFEGVLRSDLLITDLENGEKAINTVVNFDRSWNICEKNVYGYLEYFHNSIGSKNVERGFANSDILSRVSRGEVYTIGRDYLATGVRVEVDPLVNFLPGVILNVQDGSGVIQLRTTYDLQQNLVITAGTNMPFGARGTEFGGIRVPDEDSVIRGGTLIYFRVARYF